jgi:hypothetical protein
MRDGTIDSVVAKRLLGRLKRAFLADDGHQFG